MSKTYKIGVIKGDGIGPEIIDEADKDYCVIDHNTCERDHAEDAHDGQVISQQHMTHHRPDNSKGHGKHDHEGLGVRTEHGGDNNKNAQYGQRKADKEAAERFAHLFLLSLKIYEQSRVALFQLRKIAGRQLGKDFVGIGLVGIDTGTHGDTPHPVGADKGCIPRGHFHVGH